MAILKCKYCGGSISAFPDNALGTCAACGSTMTLPVNTSKQRTAAHNCGNYLRRSGKFEKALKVYGNILEEDAEDAEASWCSALCRFGILYEQAEDGSFYPVCTRPEAGSFTESGEYLAALAHSDGAVHLQYVREAARIAQAPSQPAAPQKADTSLLLKKAFKYLEGGNWQAASNCCDQILSETPDNAMAHLGKLLAELHCSGPKDLVQCSQPFAQSENYQNAVRYADQKLAASLQSANAQVQRKQQMAQIDTYYQSACRAMEAAATNEDFRQAARMFTKLARYRDAQAKAKECLRRAEILRVDAIYRAAVSARDSGSMEELEKAADLFAHIPGWRDANIQAVECRRKLEAMQAASSERKGGSLWKRVVLFVLAIALTVTAAYLTVTKYIIPEGKYRDADALLAAGNKADAIIAFRALGTYKDSEQRVLGIQEQWYSEAEMLLSAGDVPRAAMAFGGLLDYEDARQRSRMLWDTIVRRHPICAGGWFTVGLNWDKSASAVGDNRDRQCNLAGWTDVVSVSAGWSHTAGLRLDGTVITAGYNSDGRGSTEDWKDIVCLSAGQWHTVGLKNDGTPIAVGCSNDGRIDFDGWQEIIAVSAGRNHTVGLTAAGTALAVGRNEEGQCNVTGWTDLSDISAGGAHTVGLKTDRTVVAAGDNQDGQCQVDDWTNIIAVAAGYYHTVGLKADGTVVAVGLNGDGQCETSQWSDIVAIAAGGWHTVGLRKDGTVVAVGRNVHQQCETGQWENMLVS